MCAECNPHASFESITWQWGGRRSCRRHRVKGAAGVEYGGDGGGFARLDERMVGRIPLVQIGGQLDQGGEGANTILTQPCCLHVGIVPECIRDRRGFDPGLIMPRGDIYMQISTITRRTVLYKYTNRFDKSESQLDHQRGIKTRKRQDQG
ncbi:hypothetical protein BJV74DRAFT_589426 [Russula compacta]|nr:hypothetical protein BJV74DRAFT_589426 [Russula compacta]